MPKGQLTVAELGGKVDVAWKGFREAVRHVGRAKMDQPTSAGWTYHDLVAHVAGWHDLAARQLRLFRTTGACPGPGDEAAVGVAAFNSADEFNARLVSAHRLVGAEALVDELDTTFRAVRTEIALLTDDQVNAHDGWAAALIGGNTFDHYAEHALELAS